MGTPQNFPQRPPQLAGSQGAGLGEDPGPCIAAGIALAKRAGAAAGAYAALDVGPLGGMLEPFGDMAFAEAYGMFAEIMEAGAAAGGALAGRQTGLLEHTAHASIKEMVLCQIDHVRSTFLSSAQKPQNVPGGTFFDYALGCALRYTS